MWKFGKLWAGDEGSYEHTVTALASALGMQESGKPEPRSSLLSITNGVGVVRIEGSMIPGHAGWMEMFGVVGYADIRNAVIEAALNPDVKSILLSVSSGGGAVAGCDDCASVIAQVRSVKPIVSYADGVMASAAYWIGSQADMIFAESTAIVGSIGVIMKHAEASKMRQQAGITDTVIRAGEFKQLANQVEPLTAVAKEGLQTMADDVYSVFRSAVATARGMSEANVDSKIGRGREFVGQKAVSAGLVDGIATYDGALAAAKALQPIDAGMPRRQNAQSTGANMALTKRTLSAEMLAAIASGAVVEASATQVTAEATATDAAAAAATAAATAETGDPVATAEATAAAAVAATAAAEATAAAGAAGAVAVKAETELVTFLRGELAASQEKLTANAIELAALRADATIVKDTQPKLLEIARGAVSKLQIALGGSGAAAATMSPLEAIAAHAEVSAKFNDVFKVGGAAATSAATDKTKPTPAAAANVHSIHASVARAASK